jgi:hypothetical protein
MQTNHELTNPLCENVGTLVIYVVKHLLLDRDLKHPHSLLKIVNSISNKHQNCPRIVHLGFKKSINTVVVVACQSSFE